MQDFLSGTMAASLFIHTVFGCCWHHAHSHVQGSDATAFQAESCCSHHDQSDHKPLQKPCKCNLECEVGCIYVAPPKVQIDSPRGVAPFDLAAIISASADDQIMSTARWDLASRPVAIELPLRLHLLKQMLLI